MGDNFNIFENGRQTHFFKMENGREPNFKGKWKMLEYARIKYCYKI